MLGAIGELVQKTQTRNRSGRLIGDSGDFSGVQAAQAQRERCAASEHIDLDLSTSIVYTIVVKNITLSADENLIEAARKKARDSNRTLNDEFRRWLERYTAGEDRAAEALSVMERIASYAGTGGRRFSRDELNER